MIKFILNCKYLKSKYTILLVTVNSHHFYDGMLWISLRLEMMLLCCQLPNQITNFEIKSANSTPAKLINLSLTFSQLQIIFIFKQKRSNFGLFSSRWLWKSNLTPSWYNLHSKSWQNRFQGEKCELLYLKTYVHKFCIVCIIYAWRGLAKEEWCDLGQSVL